MAAKLPTYKQVKRIARSLGRYGSVSDVYARLPDEYRIVFKPNHILALSYLLYGATPKWRLLKRRNLKNHIKELHIVTKPDYRVENDGF